MIVHISNFHHSKKLKEKKIKYLKINNGKVGVITPVNISIIKFLSFRFSQWKTSWHIRGQENDQSSSQKLRAQS